ncbi:MAG: hypothetical protein QOF94_1124 [Acidobacteriaceae bacterium]
MATQRAPEAMMSVPIGASFAISSQLTQASLSDHSFAVLACRHLCNRECSVAYSGSDVRRCNLVVRRIGDLGVRVPLPQH